KIKERRDWEQRMRWTDQAKTILTGLSSAVAAILAASRPGDGITKENKEKAGKIQTDAAKLGEDYNQLTTNHWAIITNVSDREATDRAFAEATDKAKAIKNLFAADSTSVDR